MKKKYDDYFTNEETQKQANQSTSDENFCLKLLKRETQNSMMNIAPNEPVLHRKAPFIYLPHPIQDDKDYKIHSEKLQSWFQKEENQSFAHSYRQEHIFGSSLKKEFGTLIGDFKFKDRNRYTICRLDVQEWAMATNYQDVQNLIMYYGKLPVNFPAFNNSKQKHIKKEESDSWKCTCGFLQVGESLNAFLNLKSDSYIVTWKGKDPCFLITPKKHEDNISLSKSQEFYDFVLNVVSELYVKWNIIIDSISFNFGKWETINSYSVDIHGNCHGHSHLNFGDSDLKKLVESENYLPKFLQKTTFIKEDLRILKDFMVEKRLTDLENDVKSIKNDVTFMRKDIILIKWDAHLMKKDIQLMKEDFQLMKKDILSIQTNIQSMNGILLSLLQKVSDNSTNKETEIIQVNPIESLSNICQIPPTESPTKIIQDVEKSIYYNCQKSSFNIWEYFDFKK